MKKAVCIVLINPDNKYLAVSRKDNKELFGLAGGKVDDGESLEEAIIRETFEETNLEVFNIRVIGTRTDGDGLKAPQYEVTCFVGDYRGEILSQEELDEKGETGVVKWVDREVLETGFFGEYNTVMFKKLDLLN